MVERPIRENPWDEDFEPKEKPQLSEQQLKELDEKSEKVKKGVLYLAIIIVASFAIGFVIIMNFLGPISCPSGSTIVGSPGSADSYCIDNNRFNNGQKVLYKQAIALCSRASKSLCTDVQHANGCEVLLNVTENNEPDEVDQTGEWVFTEGFGNIVQGIGSCSAKIVASDVAEKPFRCCK